MREVSKGFIISLGCVMLFLLAACGNRESSVQTQANSSLTLLAKPDSNLSFFLSTSPYSCEITIFNRQMTPVYTETKTVSWKSFEETVNIGPFNFSREKSSDLFWGSLRCKSEQAVSGSNLQAFRIVSSGEGDPMGGIFELTTACFEGGNADSCVQELHLTPLGAEAAELLTVQWNDRSFLCNSIQTLKNSFAGFVLQKLTQEPDPEHPLGGPFGDFLYLTLGQTATLVAKMGCEVCCSAFPGEGGNADDYRFTCDAASDSCPLQSGSPPDTKSLLIDMNQCQWPLLLREGCVIDVSFGGAKPISFEVSRTLQSLLQNGGCRTFSTALKSKTCTDILIEERFNSIPWETANCLFSFGIYSVGCFEDCENGLDDNHDGNIDCEDFYCAQDCRQGGEEICDNRIDDDDDGRIDCNDMGDCFQSPLCQEDCTNGIDDNGNSLVDCDDVNYCGGNPACFSTPAEDCTNGIDDNGNSLVDCDDLEACGSHPACSAVPAP